MSMRHIRRFDENQKINFQDLILLFAELSDDYLPVRRVFGDIDNINRNIAIETGEYFRSKPFLLKDIVDPSDEKHKEDADSVIRYLERNKPFVINIQVNSDNKVDDTLKILNFVKNNEDQMKYFGYQLEDFFIREGQYISGTKTSLFNLKYIPV